MQTMNWMFWLLLVVSILYTATGIAYVFSGRGAMCLVFVGYTIANVGLMIDALK